MTDTVGGLLDSAVEEHADRPALLWQGAELAYAELRQQVVVLAKRLERSAGPAGLVGQRIAIIAPNSPALAVATFAAWRVGAVAVPLTARLREWELERILGDAEPTAVVCVASHGGYSFAEALERLSPGLPTLRSCLIAGPAGEVEDERRSGATRVSEPLAAEVAALLYSSGTTGAPRGALVSHAREVNGARAFRGLLELKADDRAVLIVPISHAFGLTCFLATLAAGAAVVLVESTFSPGPLLRALDERRPTLLHGSPTLFASLLDSRPEALDGIRSGLVAGAPSPPAMLERLAAHGLLALNVYGLTEAGAVSSCRLDDPPAVRLTTVGRALPGFELRVANDGVLELRGSALTPGYFGRSAPDVDAFVDGWFRTGDLATIEGGYVRIVGRAKDVVQVGGFTVVPAEVEAVLLEHPDVLEAAVLGRPSERMGEVLEAFVVARPGAVLTSIDLLRFARSRVAGYKVPYALRMLPSLPVLASGKPDRRRLRNLAAAGFAGSDEV